MPSNIPKGRSFSVWLIECFAQYPECVRRRYARFASDIGENNDYTTFGDKGLNAELLDDRNTFSNLSARFDPFLDLLWAEAPDRCTDFVAAYGLVKRNRNTLIVVRQYQQQSSFGVARLS
jgi:hypothetical protein